MARTRSNSKLDDKNQGENNNNKKHLKKLLVTSLSKTLSQKVIYLLKAPTTWINCGSVICS